MQLYLGEQASPAASFSAAAFSAAEDLAACHRTLRGGSRSFFVASLFLPRAVCEPAAALYAFCRCADDAVDLSGDARAALARLHERLDRVYAERPLPMAADRALADIVRRFALPRALLDALLEGFSWDAAGRGYETFADLTDYAARVAGAVGAMMAMLMGARAAAVVARACDLGVAMQLSNIARDVGEDARAGRLYLPRNWMRAAGLDPDGFLADPRYSPALASVVARLLGEAEVLYRRAETGIAHLPAGCRPGIRAARLLYAEIGHEVARRGCDSVTSRAVVPRHRKIALLGRALAAVPSPAHLLAAQPLPAVAYLVDAVTAAPPAYHAPPQRSVRRRTLRLPVLGVDERVGWVIDLFDRLEQRERLGSTLGPTLTKAPGVY
jgi:phytoene synthase